MSDFLLHINSTTSICSVAVSDGIDIIAHKESSEANSHTEVITLFIAEAMAAADLSFDQLSAVCIASGAGSYTSLRVGYATAKGICFAHNLPLIAIRSLDILASSMTSETSPGDYIIPMIDARRMEVYTAIYDHHGNKIEADHAHVLDVHSFENLHNESIKYHIGGDGAEKSMPILLQKNHLLHQRDCSAVYMPPLAVKYLSEKKFVDVAYCEPFYLKGANITKSKKKYF